MITNARPCPSPDLVMTVTNDMPCSVLFHNLVASSNKSYTLSFFLYRLFILFFEGYDLTQDITLLSQMLIGKFFLMPFANLRQRGGASI